MGSLTPNMSLFKPATTDFVDVTIDLSNNFDIIDALATPTTPQSIGATNIAGTSTAFARVDHVHSVDGAHTWTGTQTFSNDISISGHLLAPVTIHGTAVTIEGTSTSTTPLYINATSGHTATIIEALVNGTSKFSIDAAGDASGASFKAFGGGGVPRLYLKDTGAGSDGKVWDLVVNNTDLLGRLINDAEDASTTWLKVTRSGTTVSAIEFDGTAKWVADDTYIGRDAAGAAGARLHVNAGAAGSGVSLTVESSGTDESMYLSAKGNGGLFVTAGNGGAAFFQIDRTDSHGAMQLTFWDSGSGTLKTFQQGAADSGGTGYRMLRVVN